MTDITDQDRRDARAWAANVSNQGKSPHLALATAARVILATVDAPTRTLAEALRYRADLLDNGDPDGDTPQALRDLATHAAQMEHDLTEARAEVGRLDAVAEDYGRRATAALTERDEARAEVKRERDLGDALAHERDDTRAELERVRNAVDPEGAGLPPGMTISEAVQTLVDGIPTGERVGLTDAQLKREYDLIEARAKVDRLEAAREIHAHMYREARDEVDQARSELAEVTNARDSLREDYDHARAEVDRLTAEDKRKDKAAAEGIEILLRKNGDLANTIARLVTTSNIINNGGRITYTEKDGKPVQESDTTTWKADE